MNELPHIDVEIEMSACVRKIGGVVLADELGPSPDFLNADYLFRDENTVAELKCMDKDKQSDGKFVAKILELRNDWVRRGLVPPPLPGKEGEVHLNSAAMPEECLLQVLDEMKKRLRRLVEKANKQIRQTQNRLAPQAKGLMLLANDGDNIFEVDVVLYLLNRLFQTGRYRGINTVVYFAANRPGSAPDLPLPALHWVTTVISEKGSVQRDEVPPALLTRLKNGWFDHFGTLRGGRPLEFNRSGAGPDEISKFRFH